MGKVQGRACAMTRRSISDSNETEDGQRPESYKPNPNLFDALCNEAAIDIIPYVILVDHHALHPLFCKAKAHNSRL